MTLLVAEQRMEQLHGVEWGFDASGLPLTDDTGLNPSPLGTLSPTSLLGRLSRREGIVAWRRVGDTASRGRVCCRWSVEPLPTNPNNTLVLQVLVTRQRNRGAADTAPALDGYPTRPASSA